MLFLLIISYFHPICKYIRVEKNKKSIIRKVRVKIGVSRGNARLAPAFAGSVFERRTRETKAAAPFFGVFQPFSSPLESKSFRISNETRAKGGPRQAQRSGLHGEKEETRSTAEEKAAALGATAFSEPCGGISDAGATGRTRTGDLLITNQLLYRLSHSSI